MLSSTLRLFSKRVRSSPMQTTPVLNAVAVDPPFSLPPINTASAASSNSSNLHTRGSGSGSGSTTATATATETIGSVCCTRGRAQTILVGVVCAVLLLYGTSEWWVGDRSISAGRAAHTINGSGNGMRAKPWTVAPAPIPHSSYSEDELNYTAIIDAGSSGSRIYVYSFLPPTFDRPYAKHYDVLDVQLVRNRKRKALDPATRAAAKSDPLHDSNPENEFVVMKTSPGLSSYADDPERAWKSLIELLDFARQHIPESKQADTPLFVMATAGMRMLPAPKQTAILSAVRAGARSYGAFTLVEDSQVSIITGQMEGVYAWIALNDALRRWRVNSQTRTFRRFAVSPFRRTLPVRISA